MTNTPNSHSWPAFVQQQRNRILRRLERYNKISTAKEQLDELGDLTPYQQYKINTVSRHLIEALKRMDEGTYGYCKYCGEAIPMERLQRVPGALQCVKCIKTE
jgi:RNA polymerase-binding transcription factor DksA